jgi:hypothetical protein
MIVDYDCIPVKQLFAVSGIINALQPYFLAVFKPYVQVAPGLIEP